MLTRSSTVAPAILLLAILACACDSGSPSAPSSVRATPADVPPAPRQVLGVWNVTAHLTAASGGECVGDTLLAQIGVPKNYSLTMIQNGSKIDVALASTSGDYACTFTGGSGDSRGFSFGRSEGWFSCERGGHVQGFRCANGMQRDLLALGQSLSGRISGDEISGTWDVSWVVMLPDELSLETKAEFTGGR